MYEVTIKSNHIYKDEPYFDIVSKSGQSIVDFKRAVFGTYNLVMLENKDKVKYDTILNGDSLHVYVKKKYNVNDYVANSIVNEAKDIVKSRTSLQKDIRDFLSDMGIHSIFRYQKCTYEFYPNVHMSFTGKMP